MTIERRLRWRQHAGDFDTEQKRILLALSSKKWLWRTLESLQSVTRLEYEDLSERLADLIENGLVKGSVNRRNGEPIFGLSERVGGANPMQQQT
jgi:RIO-like serine/threonine protein kinase